MRGAQKEVRTAPDTTAFGETIVLGMSSEHLGVRSPRQDNGKEKKYERFTSTTEILPLPCSASTATYWRTACLGFIRAAALPPMELSGPRVAGGTTRSE